MQHPTRRGIVRWVAAFVALVPLRPRRADAEACATDPLSGQCDGPCTTHDDCNPGCFCAEIHRHRKIRLPKHLTDQQIRRRMRKRDLLKVFWRCTSMGHECSAELPCPPGQCCNAVSGVCLLDCGNRQTCDNGLCVPDDTAQGLACAGSGAPTAS